MYNLDGKGNGAVNVSVCVSRRPLAPGFIVRLVRARRASGANTVKYDERCGICFKAKGLVGSADVERVGRGRFAENGSRLESSDDIGSDTF